LLRITPSMFQLILLVFLVYCSSVHRHLHSFPTRRSSDLVRVVVRAFRSRPRKGGGPRPRPARGPRRPLPRPPRRCRPRRDPGGVDRKSTRLNSSHVKISYAVFCLKKKNYKMKATYSATTR